MVLDSESEVVVTDVLVPEESSSGSHLRSQLEFNVITKDWSVVNSTLLVNLPSLVESIVAVVVDNVSVMRVRFSVNIEALTSVVADVSSRSVEPSDLLVDSSGVWLDVGSNVDSPVLSSLVRDSVTSFGPGSDGLGSSVKGPPLSVVGWIVVLDSESELVSTNVLVPEESSSVLHH